MSHRQIPPKTCLVCGLPFDWRKKWEDCWEEVKYCSERCRRNRDDAMEEPDEPEWTKDDEGFWVPPESEA